MSQTVKRQEFKEILQNVVPNVFSVINGDPNWSKIESGMQLEYDKRMKIPKFVSSYLKYNFYDIVYLATQKNDWRCIHILGLFDRIFQYFSQSAGQEIKSRVSKKIKDNILTSFNSDYIHFMGETAAFLIITSGGKYSVVNSEEKIPFVGNNKYADWHIRDLESDEIFFIEVVNIHLVSSDRKENLDRTLQKIQQKKVEKLGSGNELDNFYILPIIWSDESEKVIRLNEDLENAPKIPVNYHGPYTLCQAGKKDENGIHIQDRFDHISMLKEHRKQGLSMF